MKAVVDPSGHIGFSYATAAGPQLARWSPTNGIEFAILKTDIVGVTVNDINSEGILGCTAFTLPIYEQEAFLWNGSDLFSTLTEFAPKSTHSQLISLNDQLEVLLTTDTGYWNLSERCVGDVNNNGVVNVVDILEMIAVWGTSSNEPCSPDFDGSGFVDVGDLLICIANWGPCKE